MKLQLVGWPGALPLDPTVPSSLQSHPRPPAGLISLTTRDMLQDTVDPPLLNVDIREKLSGNK